MNAKQAQVSSSRPSDLSGTPSSAGKKLLPTAWQLPEVSKRKRREGLADLAGLACNALREGRSQGTPREQMEMPLGPRAKHAITSTDTKRADARLMHGCRLELDSSLLLTCAAFGQAGCWSQVLKGLSCNAATKRACRKHGNFHESHLWRRIFFLMAAETVAGSPSNPGKTALKDLCKLGVIGHRSQGAVPCLTPPYTDRRVDRPICPELPHQPVKSCCTRLGNSQRFRNGRGERALQTLRAWPATHFAKAEVKAPPGSRWRCRWVPGLNMPLLRQTRREQTPG